MNYIKSLLAFDTASMKIKSVLRHIILESKLNYYYFKANEIIIIKVVSFYKVINRLS